MSLQLQMKLNDREMRKYMTKVLPKQMERARISSMNKATAKSFTEVVKKIRTEIPIPAAVLKGSKARGTRGKIKKFNYTRATQRSRLWMALSGIPLAKVFTGKRAKTGVAKYQRYLGGTLQGRSAADAFIATMPTGHRGVFVRKANAAASGGRDKHGRLRKGRFGIQEVAINVRKVGLKRMKAIEESFIFPEFKKEYERQLQRRFDKDAR